MTMATLTKISKLAGANVRRGRREKVSRTRSTIPDTFNVRIPLLLSDPIYLAQKRQVSLVWAPPPAPSTLSQIFQGLQSKTDGDGDGQRARGEDRGEARGRGGNIITRFVLSRRVQPSTSKIRQSLTEVREGEAHSKANMSGGQ